MATGGAKTTAGPSVMGPAGQHEGPLPGGQTQTAAGRPSRPENREAKDEGEDRRMELAVTRDVRHRVAEAMALFDVVFSLARKAVEESEHEQASIRLYGS